MLNEALDRTSWPNFFVLLRVASLVLQALVTFSALKKSVNSVGTLRVRSGKESFGFNKAIGALLDTCLRRRSSFTPLQTLQSQNRWLKLITLGLFVKKLLWMNWTCCFLLTILASFPRVTTIACSLMTNGKPVYATARPWKLSFVQNFALHVIKK